MRTVFIAPIIFMESQLLSLRHNSLIDDCFYPQFSESFKASFEQIRALSQTIFDNDFNPLKVQTFAEFKSLRSEINSAEVDAFVKDPSSAKAIKTSIWDTEININEQEESKQLIDTGDKKNSDQFVSIKDIDLEDEDAVLQILVRAGLLDKESEDFEDKFVKLFVAINALSNLSEVSATIEMLLMTIVSRFELR